jgi:hypothetical protein
MLAARTPRACNLSRRALLIPFLIYRQHPPSLNNYFLALFLPLWPPIIPIAPSNSIVSPTRKSPKSSPFCRPVCAPSVPGIEKQLRPLPDYLIRIFVVPLLLSVGHLCAGVFQTTCTQAPKCQLRRPPHPRSCKLYGLHIRFHLRGRSQSCR